MDDDVSADFFFDKEQIMPMVEEIVNNVLIKETFDENRTQLLVDQVVGRTMAALSELKMPMKFVVSCIIVQNNGAGWSSSTVTHCDRRSDDYLEYVWPNKKMKEASTCHLNALVTVGGFLL